MRNRRQGPSEQEGGENITIHQLMETINTLQETVVSSKADKERLLAEIQVEQALRQYQFRVELDASCTSNEELRRANEELRRDLQCLGERATGERILPIPVRARPMPFSQDIMDVVKPTNFMTSKITFTGFGWPYNLLRSILYIVQGIIHS